MKKSVIIPINMPHLYNTTSNKNKRRQLRTDMPGAENIIWGKIRGRQINEYKFRRQFGIDTYIVDFYCPKARLAIEIDGDSHFEPNAVRKDEIRQKYIESLGIKVIRFTNLEVRQNLEAVIEKIMRELGIPEETPPVAPLG